MPKLNIGRDRRKLPWYEHLGCVAAMLVGLQSVNSLSGLGILITAGGTLAGIYVAFYLVSALGKRLGERVPAFKSEHVGYFDR